MCGADNTKHSFTMPGATLDLTSLGKDHLCAFGHVCVSGFNAFPQQFKKACTEGQVALTLLLCFKPRRKSKHHTASCSALIYHLHPTVEWGGELKVKVVG